MGITYTVSKSGMIRISLPIKGKKTRIIRTKEIKPGEFYLSCNNVPVLCLYSSIREDEVEGVSLVDGSYGHNCSYLNCCPKKITLKDVIKFKVIPTTYQR